jgi:LCP family protein required for cell wall assembly
MSHNDRFFRAVIAGVVVLLCLSTPVVAFAGFDILHKIDPQSTIFPAPSVALPILRPAATATPAPLCNGPSTMFILLIGSDTRDGNYLAGLSDSMRIVRVDFVHPGLMLLTFQRDLYVEIPGISSHGDITHGKLNQAYLYGNPGFGYYDGAGQGPGLLAKTLDQNFGARVDHYIAVNTQTFVRVVDALGGIDIDLPAAIDGRVKGSRDPDRYFPAGKQHLNGYRTMLLARLRPNGDMERSYVEDLIIKALAVRIITPTVIPQMPRLIEAFYTSVQTDLRADDIAKLLCLGSMMTPDKVVPVEFPPDLFTGGRVQDPVLGYTFVWNVDFKILRAYVQYFNNGTWPASPLAAP